MSLVINPPNKCTAYIYSFYFYTYYGYVSQRLYSCNIYSTKWANSINKTILHSCMYLHLEIFNIIRHYIFFCTIKAYNIWNVWYNNNIWIRSIGRIIVEFLNFHFIERLRTIFMICYIYPVRSFPKNALK